MILDRKKAVLLVVDLQDKLIDSISCAHQIETNTKALIQCAHILGVPVIVSEQNKLGSTLPEIKKMLKEKKLYNPIIKDYFSCMREPEFNRIFKTYKRQQVILCGIEAHICVLQSALDLMKNNINVYLAADALSSHNKSDKDTAVKRMMEEGAKIASTEMIIYELLKKAGTDDFRAILSHVKQRRKSLTP
ncbi:MAG: hydrolase [Candidatus Altiarchaeales archaeon ex4484_96]|nr:MAG: hydrolase [Candidatus Altiarchaeales archaeon ex4484_96]